MRYRNSEYVNNDGGGAERFRRAYQSNFSDSFHKIFSEVHCFVLDLPHLFMWNNQVSNVSTFDLRYLKTNLIGFHLIFGSVYLILSLFFYTMGSWSAFVNLAVIVAY